MYIVFIVYISCFMLSRTISEISCCCYPRKIKTLLLLLFALEQLLTVVHEGKKLSNVHSNQDFPSTRVHRQVGPSPNQYGPPV